MVQLLIDGNTQRLKDTGRRMQMSTRGALHYLFDSPYQVCGCRQRRVYTGSHQSARQCVGRWLFTELTKDPPQFGFARMIDNVHRTTTFTSVHAHVQRTRARKAKSAFCLLDLQRGKPQVKENTVNTIPPKHGENVSCRAKVLLQKDEAAVKGSQPVFGNTQRLTVAVEPKESSPRLARHQYGGSMPSSPDRPIKEHRIWSRSQQR
jgi:hypothetical protein